MERVIGREHELGEVRTFLDVGDSPKTVLLVEGDAGIGKTTIWSEATNIASELGYRVLTARPVEAERLISFAAVADLLDGAFDDVAEKLPDPQRRALGVALLLADPAGPPPEPQAIAFAFLSALRELASASPTLVAIDDLQWVDQPSAQLLTYAARRLGDESIRFILSARSDGDVTRALDDAIDEARLERISLGPVTIGAMQHLLHEQLVASFPRPVLHRIQATSAGNPFHALELGRALLRLGRDIDPGEPLPVSAGLSDLVHDHLVSLPDATARALQIAALSSEPTPSLLQAAMSEPFDLEPAVVAEVVTIHDDRLTFLHPLYSSGIAARMSEATKRDVHLRLAQFVVNPEERAHHLALSVSEPDVDVAAELETAARDAHARGAWTAGAELLEHAVRLSPQRDPGVVPRTIAAADSHFQAGDTSRTLSLLESLSRDVASGPDRAEVLYRLAAVRGELDSDLRASMELYESALAEPSLEPLLAARIHSDLAWLASFVSSVGDGLAHAETAVALTAEIDSPETRAEALTALSFAQTLAGKGSPDGLLDPALELESSGERFRIDRSPTLVAGIKLLWSGDLEAARLRFESLRIRAFERGDETNSSIARYHLALLELQRGRIDEAVEHTREAAQLAEQTGVNVPEVRLLGAVMDAHLGRVDAAISAAVDLLANAERAHDQMNAARALGILGFVELSRGQAVEAHAYLARAFALVNEIGLGEPAFLRFIPDAVEALVSLARPDEAAAMLKRFEEAARQAGHAWALASVDRCRGLVRAAAGDLPGGLADLERAREAQQHLPFPFELARTLLALGTIERRSKRRGRARASLERALALFEQVSAPLWADRARAELDQIGGRTSAGLELTPQEQRIAELVAAGGTNREVAAALFVTVHTVEGALTRIYGKVGVRSRTELAARLAKSKSKL